MKITTRSHPGIWAICLVLSTLVFFTGCNFAEKVAKKEEKQAEKSETKRKTSIFKAIEGLKETAEKTKEMAEREPVEPVNFRELLASLPEPPDGWEATENRDARTQSYGNWRYSSATQEYKETNGDGIVTVKITDGAFIPFLYAAYTMAPAFSEETLDSYKKGFKTDEMTGWEEFDYKRETGAIHVMLYDRFIVEIRARKVKEPDTLKQFLNALNKKQLKEWADNPVPIKEAK